jgi:succinate dehydrogenase/fumarate reductase-like Fe-S protein
MTVHGAPLVLHINGQAVQVAPGTTVAAALVLASMPVTRISVSGQARSPVCGMGICQECRMRINGQVRLACQTLCAEGMRVEQLA